MGKMRIGFVGLGLMGGGMTANLLSDGYPLLVYEHEHEENVRGSMPGRGRGLCL